MLRSSLSAAALLAVGASVDASPLSSRAAAYIPQKVGEYAYKGCYSDLTNGGTRVLPLSLGNPNNTVEGCVSVAAKNGYSLAGIEYYGECWVGNKLDSSSTVQGDSACNLVCWGDSKEFCGGQGGSTGAAMQLYSLGATGPVAPINPTTTTTTTTAPAATATFVKSYTSGSKSWSRSGCQSDLRYGTRALSNQLAQIMSRTVEGCLDACTSAGYSRCGVEWDGECWGANSLDKTSITLDDSACNKVCADDKTEICGGTGGESGAAFQLFSASTSSPTTTTPASASATPTPTASTSLPTGGDVVETVNSEAGPAWSNNGCYGDLKYGTRALPNLLAQATDGTVEGCVNACQEAGYSLCGVEYQGECWGGDSIDVTSSQIDDSVCNLSCSGDQTQRCGGSQAAGTPGIAPFGASYQLYAQCGDNAATCNLTNAISCSGGYVLYDSACDSTTCPDGWFNDNQVCKQCNSVDKTCTSLTNALSCVEGHVLYQASCSRTTCPDGYFGENRVCKACNTFDKTCTSLTSAQSCLSGHVLFQSGCSLAKCPDTYYANSASVCQSCGPFAKTCTSPSVATSCTAGHVLYQNSCSLTQCPSGWYADSSNVCRQCTGAGVLTCSSASIATSCSSSYYLNGQSCSTCNSAFPNSITCTAAGPLTCTDTRFVDKYNRCSYQCYQGGYTLDCGSRNCRSEWTFSYYIQDIGGGNTVCSQCEYYALGCDLYTGKTTKCYTYDTSKCTNY
ncbi:hypothetical protein JCM8097_001670 [Rhodosporidiobolus ruineniae]